jgi:hypothetical protein
MTGAVPPLFPDGIPSASEAEECKPSGTVQLCRKVRPKFNFLNVLVGINSQRMIEATLFQLLHMRFEILNPTHSTPPI